MSVFRRIVERVSQPWTFQRLLYVIMGGWLVLQASSEGQWTWVAFGLYFASMGVFSFGCAAGCGVSAPMTTNYDAAHDIHYTEYKVVDTTVNTEHTQTTSAQAALRA